MPGRAFCRQCNQDHDRPVGRNCRRKVGDAAVTTVSVRGEPVVSDNALPSTSAAPASDVNLLILQKLTGIDDKLVSLENRVKVTETVLADRTTNLESPAVLPGTSSVSKKSVKYCFKCGH